MGVTIIATRDGVIDAGDVQSLAKLTAKLKGAKVWLHLHGGLVPEGGGRRIAERLSGKGPGEGFKLSGDWEQVYVVWRTGAIETLKENWEDLLNNDRLYKAVFKKLLSFVSRKLGAGLVDGRGVAQKQLTDAEIEALFKEERTEAFAELDTIVQTEVAAGRGPFIITQNEAQLSREFRDELALDHDFNEAIADMTVAINVNTGRSTASGGNVAAGNASYRRLNRDIQGEVTGALPQGNARVGALAIGQFLLNHGVRIAIRVIQRFRARRDHGLYPTIAEELVRECYGDFIGATIWGMMKKDAGDHFDADGLGTALAGALSENPPAALSVTAHSAGSIWASEMLRAAPPGFPKFDLTLLAPAVRIDLFAQAIGANEALIKRCRMYTMNDNAEQKDPVLGEKLAFLYPRSLLYLVSGLFEERVTGGEHKAFADAPLLGMQRFLTGEGAWIEDVDQLNARKRVLEFFSKPNRRIVYSPNTDGPGLSCDGKRHVDFDSTRVTLGSIVQFVTTP